MKMKSRQSISSFAPCMFIVLIFIPKIFLCLIFLSMTMHVLISGTVNTASKTAITAYTVSMCDKLSTVFFLRTTWS